MQTKQNQNTALATSRDQLPASQTDYALMEKVVVGGDLSQLSPAERMQYYSKVCESNGLNPLTRPLEYIQLDGKLTLYARKDCADQLRKNHNITFTKIEKSFNNGLCIVTAYAENGAGRSDVDIGAVPIEKEGGEWKSASNGKRYFAGNGHFEQLRGDALANAIMKAMTKAKRRVTLSICGLGLPDETEIETIPNARQVEVTDSGEIVDNAPPAQSRPAQVYDGTGQPVAADKITADQEDDLIAAITELAAAAGYEYTIALEKLSDWYASKRDGEELPKYLREVHPDDYPALLRRVQSWIKAVEKQNAAAAADQPETIAPSEYAMNANGGLPATSAADEL